MEAETLLRDARGVRALAAAGVELYAGLREEVRRALVEAIDSPEVRVGVALLPFFVEPGGRPLRHDWGRLRAAAESSTAFFLVSPWKRGGSFELRLTGWPRRALRLPPSAGRGGDSHSLGGRLSVRCPGAAGLLAR